MKSRVMRGHPGLRGQGIRLLYGLPGRSVPPGVLKSYLKGFKKLTALGSNDFNDPKWIF